MLSVIGPVQSRYHEAVQLNNSKVERICWKGSFWATGIEMWWLLFAYNAAGQ